MYANTGRKFSCEHCVIMCHGSLADFQKAAAIQQRVTPPTERSRDVIGLLETCATEITLQKQVIENMESKVVQAINQYKDKISN